MPAAPPQRARSPPESVALNPSAKAAVAAREFDAPVAERCLDYVWRQFKGQTGFSKGGGHDYYTHLYASQGYYMAGDKYWDEYFPATRDQLLQRWRPGPTIPTPTS